MGGLEKDLVLGLVEVGIGEKESEMRWGRGRLVLVERLEKKQVKVIL